VKGERGKGKGVKLTHILTPNSQLPPLLKIHNHQLPLAVDREVAAHLQQIEGITVSFLTPNDRKFSYTESQLGGLEITGGNLLTDSAKMRIDSLLKYYANCYHHWEIVN
jgi:hypothetical protein